MNPKSQLFFQHVLGIMLIGFTSWARSLILFTRAQCLELSNISYICEYTTNSINNKEKVITRKLLREHQLPIKYPLCFSSTITSAIMLSVSHSNCKAPTTNISHICTSWEFNNTLQLSTSSTNYYLPAFLMNPGSFLAPHAIMWSLEALFPF